MQPPVLCWATNMGERPPPPSHLVSSSPSLQCVLWVMKMKTWDEAEKRDDGRVSPLRVEGRQGALGARGPTSARPAVRSKRKEKKTRQDEQVEEEKKEHKEEENREK